MDWIFDNLEIVAVVALAIGSAFKQLVETAKSNREEKRQRDYGEQAEPEELEPEWIPEPIPREFKPPPPLPEPEPIHLTLPPQIDPDPGGELLRKQLEMQEAAQKFRKQQSHLTDKSLQRTADRTLRARSATHQKSGNSLRTQIRTQLGTPSTARTAIALREVLGKPVGLRQGDR